MAGLRHDDLTIPQGSTWGMAWPIVDDAGEPVSVAGWSARGQVRSTPASATVLFIWSTVDGSAEVVDDTVILRLTPAQSSAFTWRTAVYDLEITNPSSQTFRVAQGRIVIDPEITR